MRTLGLWCLLVLVCVWCLSGLRCLWAYGAKGLANALVKILSLLLLTSV